MRLYDAGLTLLIVGAVALGALMVSGALERQGPDTTRTPESGAQFGGASEEVHTEGNSR